jgi:hypothetical protein
LGPTQPTVPSNSRLSGIFLKEILVIIHHYIIDPPWYPTFPVTPKTTLDPFEKMPKKQQQGNT